jgi:type VI secretion system secreted protein Hcp
MAYEFYVTIEGTKQNAFKGESIRDDHKAKIAGLAYQHQIIAPRDISSGQASGSRQHGPVIITKEWGAASPQIFQALVTNEVLKSVLIEFYATSAEGVQEVYHTVKLINAMVSKISQSTGSSSKTENSLDTHELEEISFTYQRIEMENIIGKTSAVDDWKV